MEDGTKRYSVRSSVICSMASRLLTCFASASCLEGDLVRLSCGTGPAKNYAATTSEMNCSLTGRLVPPFSPIPSQVVQSSRVSACHCQDFPILSKRTSVKSFHFGKE